MDAFKGFVIKEFRQIYRDKRTLTVLFGMPATMMILFGFAIRNEINNAKIGILDFSKDQTTQAIIQKLGEAQSFQLYAYLDSYEDVEKVFREGKVKEIVVFEQGFGEKLTRYGEADIQIITDATDPNLANLAQNYTNSIIMAYTSGLNSRGRINSAGLEPHIKMMYNPEMRSVNLFVPGLIAVILMLISALMTSITITKEKELGNMEILLVSPLKPIYIITGKVLPYVFLSLVNVITILILAKFVFEVPFQGSYFLFFCESLLFIITALSHGVFISTVSNNQQTAMMIALVGLLLPTILLSGFIFPVSSMPVILQVISHIIPAKWFLIIVRGIMLKGVGIGYLWKETFMLCVIALFFISLSLKKFKVRLQ